MVKEVKWHGRRLVVNNTAEWRYETFDPQLGWIPFVTSLVNQDIWELQGGTWKIAERQGLRNDTVIEPHWYALKQQEFQTHIHNAELLKFIPPCAPNRC